MGLALGADATRRAGVEDGVDHHWGALFKATLLSTILAVGTDLGADQGESDIVRAMRRGTGDTANQAGQRIVRRYLNVQPTLTIRPGFPVRMIVTRDLVLQPYRTGGRSRQARGADAGSVHGDGPGLRETLPSEPWLWTGRPEPRF